MNTCSKLLSVFALIGSLMVTVNAHAGLQPFEGCVFDKTTQKKVVGAKVLIWTSEGTVGSMVTESDGCFKGISVSSSLGATGGFIEAIATIRGKHYRQQFLLPNNFETGVGDNHYDFFLDTFPRSGMSGRR